MQLLKFSLCLLCILYPFFIGFTFGIDKGLSMLSCTQYEPLYIFINASTSYFLFGYNKHTWKIMSVSLLMLTCFSTHQYRFIHNLFAIIFFLTLQMEIKNKRVFIISILLLLFKELFLFEAFNIIVLALYNLKLLNKFGRIKFN